MRQNAAWVLTGNVVYSGCQWGMLAVLAKLGTPAAVGVFALGIAATTPVVVLIGLGLRAVQATDANDQYQFGDYLALRLITAALTLLAILSIAFVVGFRSEAGMVIATIGLAKTVESISDIYYGLLIQRERMARMGISITLKGILSLAALSIAFALTGSVVWGAAALTMAWALVLVIYDIPSAKLVAGPSVDRSDVLHARWRGSVLARLAFLSMPLGFVTMLMSLSSNIPRFFIHQYRGERELGIYAAMAYLMVAGGTIVNAIGQSANPRLAKYYAAGDRSAFTGLLLRLTALGAIIGATGVVVALFAGRWLLGVVYGPEYAAGAEALVWVAIASAISFVQWFLSSGMMAARCIRVQIPLLVGSTAVTAIASFCLIPVQGLLGAALSLVAGTTALAIGTLVVDTLAIRRLPTAEERSPRSGGTPKDCEPEASV